MAAETGSRAPGSAAVSCRQSRRARPIRRKRRALPLSLPAAGLSEGARPVLAAIEDPQDHHLIFDYLKGYRRAMFKTDDAQAGTDVVASCAAFRKGDEAEAGGLDPVDVRTGYCGSGFFIDVFVNSNQIGFCVRPKGDPIPSHSPRLFSRAAWCSRSRANTSRAGTFGRGSDNASSMRCCIH